MNIINFNYDIVFTRVSEDERVKKNFCVGNDWGDFTT